MSAIEVICLILMPLAILATILVTVRSWNDIKTAREAHAAKFYDVDGNDVLVARNLFYTNVIILIAQSVATIGVLAIVMRYGEGVWSDETIMQFRTATFCILSIILSVKILLNWIFGYRVRASIRRGIEQSSE